MTRTPSPETPVSGDETFQQRVGEWVAACFPALAATDKLERSDRFIEECLELVQACGYSPARAHALVDYVFARPAGDPFQETGGVQTTLAALCNAQQLDMKAAAEAELARVWKKIDKIRAKQAAKPVGSALPVPTAPTPSADVSSLIEAVARAMHSEMLAMENEDGGEGCEFDETTPEQRAMLDRLSRAAIAATNTEAAIVLKRYREALEYTAKNLDTGWSPITRIEIGRVVNAALKQELE